MNDLVYWCFPKNYQNLRVRTVDPQKFAQRLSVKWYLFSSYPKLMPIIIPICMQLLHLAQVCMSRTLQKYFLIQAFQPLQHLQEVFSKAVTLISISKTYVSYGMNELQHLIASSRTNFNLGRSPKCVLPDRSSTCLILAFLEEPLHCLRFLGGGTVVEDFSPPFYFHEPSQGIAAYKPITSYVRNDLEILLRSK